MYCSANPHQQTKGIRSFVMVKHYSEHNTCIPHAGYKRKMALVVCMVTVEAVSYAMT